MHYLVNEDHKGMAVHLRDVTAKGFIQCCISNAVNGTDNDTLWNSSEEDGNVRRECEEDCKDGDSDTDW
jgi:hypothetical protein